MKKKRPKDKNLKPASSRIDVEGFEKRVLFGLNWK
jgi:hypothetical protein